MNIQGFQKVTLLDFPGRVACTVFLGGCNLRCPFCHNAGLVRTPNAEADAYGEVMDYLQKRKGILQGVCITGGEPLLHPDLPELLHEIKSMGYAVKLDTNGYRPVVLKSLVDAGLVDYVAMDVKNSLACYGETVGIRSFDTAPIEESIDYLMEGHIPFEFRTTLVRGLHTPESIRAMGQRTAGQERFFLQSFKDSGDLICGGLGGFTPEETAHLLAILCEYVPNAQIRGE